MAFKRDHMSGDVLNLEATELRLGLPGTTTTVAGEDFDKLSLATTSKCNKRPFLHCTDEESKSADNSTQSNQNKAADQGVIAPPTKAQVVGWPPIRCYRKNCFQAKKKEGEGEGDAGVYVKVSMDGAPFLRKIDLSLYNAYPHLLKALEDMFNCKVGEYCERGYNGSEFAPTYEDKDGDWMLVGDVPWDMFINSCKRLRIMKGSEARGLGGYCV